MFKCIETRKYNKDLKKTKLSLAQNVLLNIYIQALKNKENTSLLSRVKKLNGKWLGYSSFSLSFDLMVIFKSYGEELELVRIGTHNQIYNS